MNAFTATFEAQLDPLRRRMLWATALSVAIHLTLLWGMPVSPRSTSDNGVTTITARLESPDEVTSQDSESLSDLGIAAPAVPLAILLPPKTLRTAKAPAAQSKVESGIVSGLAPSTLAVLAPPTRDSTYYSARQLDVYPQPLGALNLQYPDTAAADRVDGRLLLLLSIDDFGVVNDVSIVESQPPGYFEEAARATFLAMRFSPGMKDGSAVKARVQIQIRYTYGEREGSIR